MLASWSEIPRSPGHAFYDKLQTVLVASDFDGSVEGLCASKYAPRRGRPSLPSGRYFRMLLVGYYEGIDSERGLVPTPEGLLQIDPVALADALPSDAWSSHAAGEGSKGIRLYDWARIGIRAEKR
jgi:hypothetical protein